MPVEQDFLPIAVATGSNVETQTAYAASGAQLTGLPSGIVLSTVLNKMLRQGSVMAYIIGQFIANTLNQAVLDNGNTATLLSQFVAAITATANSALVPQVVTVPFSATPNFNCAAGNPLYPCFEITLTGNVTGATISNTTPGQLITISILQNNVGGYSFVPPSSLPLPPIDQTANQTNVMTFTVLPGGIIVPVSGLVTLI